MTEKKSEKLPAMELLKGNFKVKNPVHAKDAEKEKSGSEKIKADLRKAALDTIGGSMVYMERDQLTWDPESEEEGKK